MEEVWKDIEGYEGRYQVSTFGEFRNVKSGRILSLNKETRGYYGIGLYKNNVCKHYLVHRLVAKAFLPNPDNLPQVNHKDEDKANNHVENLEWVDAKTNVNWGTGIERSTLSRRNDKRSKKVFQYSIDGTLIAVYPSGREAQRRTGFSQANIGNCCRGRYKQAYGFIWKYGE